MMTFLIHECIAMNYSCFYLPISPSYVRWYDVEEDAESKVFVHSWEKTACRDSLAVYKYTAYKGSLHEGDELFLNMHSRTRGNKLKLQHWKFLIGL